MVASHPSRFTFSFNRQCSAKQTMHRIVYYRFEAFLGLLFNLSLQLKWGTRTAFQMNATQLTEKRINISLLSPCGHSRSRRHVIIDVVGKQQYEAFCIQD